MAFGSRSGKCRYFLYCHNFPSFPYAFLSPTMLALSIAAAVGCQPTHDVDANDSLVTGKDAPAAKERAALLEKIKQRIEKSADLGNGNPKCARSDFAFGESKNDYELDAFELRAEFLEGNLGCTDTRQTRPPLVLSVGESASGLTGLLSPAELETLGVEGGPAKDGQVIVANFYHLKRFWIARIPMKQVSKENVIFQLEHFKITDAQASSRRSNFKLFTGVKGNFIDWANNNIAGHTQLRLHFGSAAVALTEQVLKKGQSKPRTAKITDIVLTSEAQGTESQIYDPVSAAKPLFFSVNKMVSLEEKYSDMVVRQGNRVEQFRVAGREAPEPKDLILHYLKMAKSNWRSMTSRTVKEQRGAVYITADFKPFQNDSRNCTTEVITALEAGRNKTRLQTIRGRLQDLTLQRLYPVFLGSALERMGYMTADAELATMDAKKSENGKPIRFLSADGTLKAVRKHFLENDQATCKSYFGKPEDKAKCAEWKAQLRL